MAKDDLVPILERMREQLVDFHQVVARAHERALMRIQEQATRQLRWLGLLAHELAEDTWYGKRTALLERAIIEDLQAVAQVLAVFLDELGRAASSLHGAPASEADEVGGEPR